MKKLFTLLCFLFVGFQNFAQVQYLNKSMSPVSSDSNYEYIQEVEKTKDKKYVKRIFYKSRKLKEETFYLDKKPQKKRWQIFVVL